MKTSHRSTLHLQLGQETVYLIMAIAVFAAVYMAVLLRRPNEPIKDPPIIVMKEADGYYFPTGSSSISPAFARKLTAQVLPRVREIGRQYNAGVVEVIGHTDEVPLRRISRFETNLDSALMPLLNGRSGSPPVAADNIGLGMARAVAVARLLRQQPDMEQFQIVPLSAGPFSQTNDTVSRGDDTIADRERRRIEIRVRRRTER